MKILGWSALVLGLLAGAPPSQKGSIADVPEGWVFLESEGIDTSCAAFHDRLSGAFVTYEAGFSFVITPLVESRAKLPRATSSEGEAEGVPYKVVTIRPASPEACEEIAVSFLPRGQQMPASWNFWTAACSAEQRERAMVLIFGKAHVAQSWRKEDWVHGGGFVERSHVAALAAGAPWPEVRAKLGAPGAAAKAPGHGFMVEYELRQPRSSKRPAFVTLVFNQAQQLVETRPGTLPDDPKRSAGPLVAPLGRE